jgi:polyisoprenoid-binding protein YceI
MKVLKIVVLSVLLLTIGTAQAQNWKISENYTVAFSNKDVSGVFKEMSGSIIFDATKLSSSKFDLKIKVESISTGNGIQNKHAKGDEWFDADKYPNIEFISTKIEKTDAGYKAIGKLEIHGVKKDFSIPFTFSKKGSKGTFVAKFSVDRTEFGVGKKGNDVAETLKIVATIPATLNKIQ